MAVSHVYLLTDFLSWIVDWDLRMRTLVLDEYIGYIESDIFCDSCGNRISVKGNNADSASVGGAVWLSLVSWHPHVT